MRNTLNNNNNNNKFRKLKNSAILFGYIILFQTVIPVFIINIIITFIIIIIINIIE